LTLTDDARGLDIYWYCPFPYPHIPHLARSVMQEGDRLLAHLPQGGLHDPVDSQPCGYEVLYELPDVTRSTEHRLGWALSRARTYRRRVSLRNARARSRRFDLCHIHFLNYFTDGTSLGELGKRVPLVSNVHDVLPHHRRMWPALERRLLAAQYRRAGTLLVAHETLRRQLLEEFDVHPDRVTVIPLPIPEVSEIVAPHEQGPDAERTVLFFGTLRRNKGIEVLLDAIKRMDTPGGVRFRIAGRGASEVQEVVRRAAVRDPRIEAEIGIVPDDRKDALFRSATLVVLPYTTFTSQSGVLGDAYAYRVPVVATDVGALGSTVIQDGSGWVVPPGDASALAAALESALSDDEARARAAVSARRAAADRSYEAVGRQIRDLYERVVA
jgi:glycosyltransferase involved in cell wall biosynthesis